MKLSLKRIGNSTGIILPKELLAKLGLQEGDELFANPTANPRSGERGYHKTYV